jgi:hypothetical protein
MKYPRPLFHLLSDALAEVDTPARREDYKAGRFPRSHLTKDLNMRYRWDLLWSIRDTFKLFIAPAYAEGCNDDHIDTALRKAVPNLV